MSSQSYKKAKLKREKNTPFTHKNSIPLEITGCDPGTNSLCWNLTIKRKEKLAYIPGIKTGSYTNHIDVKFFLTTHARLCVLKGKLLSSLMKDGVIEIKSCHFVVISLSIFQATSTIDTAEGSMPIRCSQHHHQEDNGHIPSDGVRDERTTLSTKHSSHKKLPLNLLNFESYCLPHKIHEEHSHELSQGLANCSLSANPRSQPAFVNQMLLDTALPNPLHDIYCGFQVHSGGAEQL